MKRLLIVGAGDLGRELASLLACATTNEWKIAGFLDDDLHALDGYKCPYGIVEKITSYTPHKDDVLICAIAKPRTKLRICKDLRSRGATFISYIDPRAVISPDSQIGEGCVIFPFAFVSNNATLGDFVQLSTYTGIGHDAVIGSGCTISGHCGVNGKVTLGEAVFVGSHVAIIPGVEIGHDAVLGAGSVIVKKVLPETTMMGQPAKTIGNFSVKI